MKEFVLVEFLFPGAEYAIWSKKLEDLEDDYIPISSDNEFEIDEDGYTKEMYVKVAGKINSQYASVIKLRDTYLASHMRISYISDELKNKYRK